MNVSSVGVPLAKVRSCGGGLHAIQEFAGQVSRVLGSAGGRGIRELGQGRLVDPGHPIAGRFGAFFWAQSWRPRERNPPPARR